MLQKECSKIFRICIQFTSESDNEKNPVLLFYQPSLAAFAFCMLQVIILTTNVYCILF